jgi:hypothetical protein
VPLRVTKFLSAATLGVRLTDGERPDLGPASRVSWEHLFDTVAWMERRYELDNLRRSLAMLSPGAHALGREDGIDLVAELEDTQERLRRLIAELRRVADEAEAG